MSQVATINARQKFRTPPALAALFAQAVAHAAWFARVAAKVWPDAPACADG